MTITYSMQESKINSFPLVLRWNGRMTVKDKRFIWENGHIGTLWPLKQWTLCRVYTAELTVLVEALYLTLHFTRTKYRLALETLAGLFCHTCVTSSHAAVQTGVWHCLPHVLSYYLYHLPPPTHPSLSTQTHTDTYTHNALSHTASPVWLGHGLRTCLCNLSGSAVSWPSPALL